MRRRAPGPATWASAAALAAFAALAGTAAATPPGLNGLLALDGVTGAGNIHTTTPAPGGPLTRITFDAAQEDDAAWSPDGTRIAFTSRRDGGNAEIYIVDADGSNAVRFTIDGSTDQDPTWSPDGGRIAWASDRDDNFDIYSANLDGTGLIRHTLNGAIPDVNPEWSPDGSAIAFESNRTGSGDVYRLSPAGTEQEVRQLTSSPAGDGSPTWSPDGSRVAFDSARGGNTDVWSVSATGGPETALRRHTTHAQPDVDPVWSPDGGRIAFSSFRNTNNWDLWTVASTGDAEADPRQVTSSVTNELQPSWQSVAPAPAVASLSPPSAFAGSGDLAVIVDGSGFVRRSVVRWNGAPRSTQFVSATRLTFVVPAADMAAPGEARVDVHTSPVGGGTSASLPFTVSPPTAGPALTITRATIRPRWRASRLRGRLVLRGTAGRPALLQMRVLRPSGRGRPLVTRRFRVRAAGTFSRTLALTPTLLPGRHLIRLREVGGGAQPLPTADRIARLAAPREGVASRAYFSSKIGGRPMKRISRRSIIFAHFTFAARPRPGRRLTVRWYPPGARRVAAVDRKPITRQVIAFIKSSGPLPTGAWRAELRYGRTRVATATVRLG
ncbi:IPT/TIG domain-containing protein [Miltoncostaea marina]|uniref:IPT/TIG domain-containing protein n=1 Tax=Miltoncostaea marina TaxID=2843215 RepID=UPI001C3C4A72|nr:IPT/TIG domain-containing protein [Miltoncostaea marina]